jgi:hypothetical protein
VTRGRHVLESTLRSQFHTDGGSVEQSTFYHHATLGFYMLAALIARRNAADLSDAVWRSIEDGIGFSAALVQPDGRLPAVGGADDGKPIRLEHLPFFDFRPYQAIGAVLFSRGDFKYVAQRFWEDALWLLGRTAADAFASLPATTPLARAALPASGYYVVRSGWSSSADYLCFDCGPQAAGLRRDGVASAAHGHADCLSVVVSLGGCNVLVDPGFFCYNGEPDWEVHFRRTRAHTTITVDGADQAQHVAKMSWVRTYDARVDRWCEDGDLGWVKGSHDGYDRAPWQVIHRRIAWLRPGGYVVLYDEVFGTGAHQVEATFQFAPGRLTVQGNQARFDERFELTWVSNVALSPSFSSGGRAPADGWTAPSLGVRRPAPRLVLRGLMGEPRFVLLTVLADSHRSALREAGRDAQRQVLSACVGSGRWSDRILASEATALSDDDVETDAPLVALTFRDGVLDRAAQAGGSTLRIRPRPGSLPSFSHSAERAV